MWIEFYGISKDAPQYSNIVWIMVIAWAPPDADYNKIRDDAIVVFKRLWENYNKVLRGEKPEGAFSTSDFAFGGRYRSENKFPGYNFSPFGADVGDSGENYLPGKYKIGEQIKTGDTYYIVSDKFVQEAVDDACYIKIYKKGDEKDYKRYIIEHYGYFRIEDKYNGYTLESNCHIYPITNKDVDVASHTDENNTIFYRRGYLLLGPHSTQLLPGMFCRVSTPFGIAHTKMDFYFKLPGEDGWSKYRPDKEIILNSNATIPLPDFGDKDVLVYIPYNLYCSPAPWEYPKH
jgi:hypothetical protein